MGPGPFFGTCIEIICYMDVIRIVSYLEDEGGLVRSKVGNAYSPFSNPSYPH